jgi:hypothetical protein
MIRWSRLLIGVVGIWIILGMGWWWSSIIVGAGTLPWTVVGSPACSVEWIAAHSPAATGRYATYGNAYEENEDYSDGQEYPATPEVPVGVITVVRLAKRVVATGGEVS